MSRQHDPYFIPLETEKTLDTPESISGGFQEQLLTAPELATKPLRFLGKAFSGLLLLVLVLVLWQTAELGLFLYQLHWSLALLFSVLLLVLAAIVGKAAVEFFLYQRDFRSIVDLQEQAMQFRDQRTTTLKTHWVSRLKKLYQEKPQQVMLEQALAMMPDYSDDSEMLAHLDAHFFRKLDQQALTRISQHSQQVALMVALSPFAAVDMLLAVWRSVRMLDEICQIYGVRPSVPARTHLLRLILEQMALAGATDFFSEQLSDQLADFTSNRLLGVISSQMASGLGVGIYSARIGLRAMALCRPIPFSDDQKPSIGRLAKNILSSLETRFQRTSDTRTTAE